MDAIGTGLVVMADGLLKMLGSLADPIVIFALVLVASLGWLATIEVESLNRISIKPQVGRH